MARLLGALLALVQHRNSILSPGAWHLRAAYDSTVRGCEVLLASMGTLCSVQTHTLAYVPQNMKNPLKIIISFPHVFSLTSVWLHSELINLISLASIVEREHIRYKAFYEANVTFSEN